MWLKKTERALIRAYELNKLSQHEIDVLSMDDKLAHEEKRKELAKRARLHTHAVQVHERDEAVARAQEMERAREAAARAARAQEEER